MAVEFFINLKFDCVATPFYSNCTFINNFADTDGGAICNRSSNSTYLTNCTFTSNTSDDGGAVYSAVYISLTNCTFTSNIASSGGAVYSKSSAHLTNCIFTSNSSSNRGGAVYSVNTFYNTDFFTNCTFTNNIASSGGAVYSYSSSKLILTNCTFTNNTAHSSGGAFWCNILLTPEDPITLKNCILWGNTAPEGAEIYEQQKPLIITYSNIQGGHIAGGIGNIDSDPLFVDALNDDLRLQETSPCINTGTADGTPADDLEGNYRPVGGGYDMGAYEYQGPIVIDSFTADPTTGEPSLIVDFICTAHDDSNAITGYQWNFGDGNTDNSVTRTVQHTYIIPGTFTATCTVINDNNDQTTASTVIEVTNDIPVAAAGQDQIIPGNSIELDGSASNDPDGNIVSWSWTLEHLENSFYDRNATGEMPTVTNLIKGNYIVTLTVTDNYGGTGTDEMHLCVAGSDTKYTQAEYEQAQQDSYSSGYTAGQNDCEQCPICPIREDAQGNKFLEGPLTIENNGLLTIQ